MKRQLKVVPCRFIVAVQQKIEQCLLVLHLWVGIFLSVRGARHSSVVRAFAHGAMGRWIDPSLGGPIELFLIPASVPRLVLTKACGMVHIKEPLLLVGKSSLCGGSGFPLSLSEWSFTTCPTPHNRK